jgi:transcriptional regulator with XRE-family HTH domain
MSGRPYKSIKAFVEAQPRSKSIPDIAKELGITPAALYAYLSRHRFPSRETALRISREFNISLNGLLNPDAEAQAS